MPKYLVISDIHGCGKNIETVLNAFQGQYDAIICCGDFLYHGPRNGVPEEYDPKHTMDLLEGLKDRIIGVRGNCDGEVDQMVLNFPIMSDNQTIFVNGKSPRKIFIHHGHLYDKEMLKRLLPEGSLIISGHTHITVLEEKDGFFWFNPGSISLPKCEDGKTCGLLEISSDGKIKIQLCQITGKILKTMEIK